MPLPGIIIGIGGGIGELTAVIALRQRGLPVQVYEAAPQILPLGAGIGMAPNAMQVFDRLGLAQRINAGTRCPRGRVCLIGDAAHVTTPYMGQGGCQAVEDAYALGPSASSLPTPPPLQPCSAGATARPAASCTCPATWAT